MTLNNFVVTLSKFKVVEMELFKVSHSKSFAMLQLQQLSLNE